VNFPFVPRDRHQRALAAEKATADHLSRRLKTAQADLATAREQLTTTVDPAEEHEVHRKALADALGEQKRHLNWDQLIAEVVRLNTAAEAWMADHAAEKQRADELAAGLIEASEEEIKAWEARVAAHWAWRPPVDREQRPVDGASGRPTHPATDLRRAQERCRALQARLDRGVKQVASR
jgi:hypothetical protein